MNWPFKLAAAAYILATNAFANEVAVTARPVDDRPIVVAATVTVIGRRTSYDGTRTAIGTKTDTALIDIPQSITVLPRALIEDQAMQSIGDVVRYAPGVGSAQGEGNRDNPIFRGNSNSADLFVDGVRDDVEYLRDLYNVAHVEVLKGPNGMIFGRGAVGGLLNRVTKQAQGMRTREIAMHGYSEGGGRVTVDLGDAITRDINLRLNAVYENTDSFRDEVHFDKVGLNPTLGLDLGAKTKLNLGYEYYDYDRTADRGIPSFNGQPADTSPSTFFGDPDDSVTNATVNSFSAMFEHDFADGITLINKLRIATYDKFYQNIYANSALTAFGTVQLAAYNNRNNRETLLSETDLLLDFQTGGIKHKVVVGTEFSRETSDNQRDNGAFQYGGPPPTTSPASSTFALYVPFSNPRASFPVLFAHVPTPSNTPAFNHVITDQASVFVQDQIELTRQWLVVLGVRYDNVSNGFHNLNPPTPATPERIEVTDDLISPRAGLIFKPVEQMSLYASYSLSKLPRAGAQLSSLTVTNSVFEPEQFTNYEVGAKWDITGHFSATIAAYQLDRSNVIAATGVAGVSTLVDGQRTRGVELGIAGQVTDAWSLLGGYAYQDAKVLSTQSATVIEGARLAQVPQNTLSLWNRYDFTPKLGAGLGVIYQSDGFAAIENKAAPANNVVLPGFVRVDGALFWTINDHLRAQFNIENLLDEKYFVNANGNNNISPGSPRAFRFGLTVNL